MKTAYQRLDSGDDGDDRVDNPLYYISKVVFVYVLLVVDMFLNSSFNSDNYGDIAQNDFWPFLFLVVQTSIQVFIFLTLFLLMCGTYLMRIGLPGVIISDFKLLGVAQLVYLVVTMALGIMRVIRFQESRDSMDPRQLWTMPGFTFTFTLQNLCAAVYYQQVLFTTFKLSEEKYYSRKYWGNLGDRIQQW